jgi:YfiH family protein
MFAIERRAGLLLVVAHALCRVPGIGHAFSTRVGPEDDRFDLGSDQPPHPATRERRRLLVAAAGLGEAEPAVLSQVHGNSVVRASFPGDAAPRADAVFWVAGDPLSPAPAVRTADCVPLLLAHARGQAVAAVHAGWRGTAAGVATRTVERLRSEAGVRAQDLVAVLGPAILGCCYEVGPEVHVAMGGAEPEGPASLDLHAVNRRQLVEAGVPAEAIHAVPLCTRCRDDLFFSHRREPGGGRMMACIGGRP